MIMARRWNDYRSKKRAEKKEKNNEIPKVKVHDPKVSPLSPIEDSKVEESDGDTKVSIGRSTVACSHKILNERFISLQDSLIEVPDDPKFLKIDSCKELEVAFEMITFQPKCCGVHLSTRNYNEEV